MIFFYVQHLLGTGHVHRIRLIVDELVRRGLATAVVTGGMPSPAFVVEGCEWIQLDPVRSDGLDFARLIDAHGRVVDEALMMRRKRKLLGEFERLEPSLVVIETYPFGRRKFRENISIDRPGA